MATPGQKFCAVTSILQTISCVSPPSPIQLFTQGDVEVRQSLQRHLCLNRLNLIIYVISCLTISVPQASCRDCELEEASSSKDTLETFCRSDFGEDQYSFTSFLLSCPTINYNLYDFFYKFYTTIKRQAVLLHKQVMSSMLCVSFFPVVKLRLTQLEYSPVSLSQFSLAAKLDVLKHGPLLGGQIRSRIELWLERDATCVKNMTRNHPRGGTFLVTGIVQGERLVVNKAYAWHKRDKNLMAAARKWKHHRCRP